MRIAHRLSQARESGTARINRIVLAREARGERIIKLNVGEPDFDTPSFVAAAANRAIQAGQTRYTNVAGTAELRDAVAQKFRDENGIQCAADDVIVGTGAKQLIFNAILATAQEGDEVIIPTPSWVSYPDIAIIAGAHPVMVSCGVETGFKITASQLAKALSERTRWLLLNSPGNPTGAVYSAAEISELVEILRPFPNACVISDDIYEKIIFDGGKFSTMAEIAPDLAESRILTVNGVSKSHAMTGWRIGYAVGPRPLILAMTKLQSQSTTNASSISQAAALAALTQRQSSEEFIARCLGAYQSRRDKLLARLVDIPGLQCQPPQGAFYAFVSCQELLTGGRVDPANGARLQTDADFCEFLLRHAGTAVVPGTEFGGEGYFRISFATSQEAIDEAVERIRTVIHDLLAA